MRVSYIVEWIVESKSDSEHLIETLSERVEDADATDFADRPLGEIVAAICRDLGVAVDWTLWEDPALGRGSAWPRRGPNAPPPDLPATATRPASGSRRRSGPG